MPVVVMFLYAFDMTMYNATFVDNSDSPLTTEVIIKMWLATIITV